MPARKFFYAAVPLADAAGEVIDTDNADKLTAALEQSLRDAIAASGRTQGDISRGTGIPQPVLSQFIHGKKSMKLRTLAPLMYYLGLEIRRKPREGKR